MKPNILITGISGFVGKVFLSRMDFSRYNEVYLLIPEPELPVGSVGFPDNVRVIKGNIEDLSFLDQINGGIDTLLHMAAVTGKVPRRTYDRVNAEAFNELLLEGKKKGIKNVLFISTIAVSFTKKKRYFYAFSKEKADELLIGSGYRFSVIRPTMILGKDSPVLKGFSIFAGSPLIPLFGGGKAVVQPVHVNDICKTVDHILENSVFTGAIFEIGGPDQITIRDFLGKISLAGGKKPRFLPIPMWIPLLLISILDRLVYSLTPLTLGQLATFRNDSIAKDNIILKKIGKEFIPLDDMIRESMDYDRARAGDMDSLNECSVYSRYLIGASPTPYVERKYLDFIKKVDTRPLNTFDRILLRISSKNPFFAKVCDAYSRFFFPHSTLRKKLGHLFAILEISPGTFQIIDDIGNKKPLSILVSLFFRGAWFAVHLSFSALVFLPLQLITGRGGKTGEKGESLG